MFAGGSISQLISTSYWFLWFELLYFDSCGVFLEFCSMVMTYLGVLLFLLIYWGDTTPATIGFLPWWPSTLLMSHTGSMCCPLLASCPPVPARSRHCCLPGAGKRLSHSDTRSWHLLLTTRSPAHSSLVPGSVGMGLGRCVHMRRARETGGAEMENTGQPNELLLQVSHQRTLPTEWDLYSIWELFEVQN